MTPDQTVFQTYEPSDGTIPVETADGTIHRAAGVGDIAVSIVGDENPAIIADVLHIPTF
jgi:hypothetical protein